MATREELIKQITSRIEAEHRKHSYEKWWAKIAAHKIIANLEYQKLLNN